MFELAAANWLIDNNYYATEHFVAFGRKMRLQNGIPTEGGGFAEADYLIELGRQVLADAKYTRASGLDIGEANFKEETLTKWARGLRDGDFSEVVVPTNATPTPGLLAKIALVFEKEEATVALSRLRFVYVAVPGF